MSARKSERLLNLLITLLVARGYVTKQRLREVIPDYREAASDEAFERMFERDKDDLRALGHGHAAREAGEVSLGQPDGAVGHLQAHRVEVGCDRGGAGHRRACRTGFGSP